MNHIIEADIQQIALLNSEFLAFYEFMRLSKYHLEEEFNKYIASFSNNAVASAKILSKPILAVSPFSSKVDDWKYVEAGQYQAAATSRIEYSDSQLSEIRHLNRIYLAFIIRTIKSNYMAVLILSMNKGLIEYFKDMDSLTLHALSQSTFPLFNWRYSFCFSPIGQDAENQYWIDHLIRNVSIPLRSLKNTSSLNCVSKPYVVYPLLEGFTKLEMRTAILAQLFPGVNRSKIRQIYAEINSKPSQSGKLPEASSWYFHTQRRRIHSTLVVYLYRLALEDHLTHAEASLAAIQFYQNLEQFDPIPADRIQTLLNQFHDKKNHVIVGSCKSCGAQYLLCNDAVKMELPSHFRCHVCVSVASGQIHFERLDNVISGRL